MRDTGSPSTIPETQRVTGNVGAPLSIVLKGEENVPPPGSGLVQMDSYDPTILTVDTCGWYPGGELADAAAFRIIFTPLQAGTTEVKMLIQPRAINPLNLPVTFFVKIDP